jgi:SNF2-related domain/Helicase conserved C-terminal domain/Bacterial SNF2 helicase associated
MALPILQKYIYNHGTEEVVKRGKKIHLTGGVQVMKIDEISTTATFRVRNDLYHNYYNVSISRFEDENSISVRCQCPYNMGEICRHEVAALFHLQELLLTQQYSSGTATYDQSLTIVRMRQIELKLLRLFTSDANYREAEDLSLGMPAKIESAADECVKATFHLADGEYPVSLKRNDDKTFNTSCHCVETQFALCKHKTALFLQLVNSYGSGYFDTIRNWDTQKNKLLQLYGYTLNDNLEGKFDFSYVDGKPILRVLDGSIKKINVPVYGGSIGSNVNANGTPITAVAEVNTKTRLGIVIDANEKKYPHFSIEIIEGEIGDDTRVFLGNVKKLDITKYIQLDKYTELDKSVLTNSRKILPQEVSKYIAKNSSYGDMWENIIDDDLTKDNKKLFLEYVHPKLLKIFELLSFENRLFYLPKNEKFVTANLQAIQVAQPLLTPVFDAENTADGHVINVMLQSENYSFNAKENELENTLLYKYQDKIFLVSKPLLALEIDDLHNIPVDAPWQDILQNTLLPLTKKYGVQFASDAIETMDGDVSALRIYLQESGDYFVLKPVFVYEEVEVPWNDELTISIAREDKLVIINRDKTSEEEWIKQLVKLHDHFKKMEAQHSLYLHAQYALKANWFYTFFETMKQWKVQTLGFESLKKFRIKSTKPTTSIHINSGMDWFDTEINVDFDGQIADINEIKKSLSVKRNYVQLGDGSFGLLPDEWLSKYSLLFKMADVSGKILRVSKYNFSVIDELYDAIDDETIRAELMEKKDNLLQLNPENRETIPTPTNLDATLRPYQESGFNWLAYLDKVKWGGLLADDMGLGKTIQTLTFLQHYKNTNNKLVALVVCPTTLLYNWQQEITKFTNGLTFLVHHGSTRVAKPSIVEEYNVVITTYGTLRSDIEMLMKVEFDYVILDESQAIKNPTSKVTKAAMLLHTKNRFALSGTPMQNNTFDIYAQLNFLNPGMLGSKEFFKDNFATPIDKFQEKTTKEHLRKLIYPFLLRRTKEQVAKDLPDKTEITLYCEMGTAQRKIYDAYRNMYRAKILGTIDDQGIDKSQFAILQGLMKLRQICDSPAILKGEEVQLQNHSVKLDELTREIKENISNHKALVFSQFLGMLGLIREKLDEEGIQYEYFDGSYTSKQRQDAIKNFQENEECRIFLISLKAGGTGLNLTAADYVYLMDPWWNPAVEQQAIDRTHRIGQTKNIFAYRYICKDTVEEKIVELKQKKNSLVRDIISDDEGIVKKLTKEDVEYLFS